MNIHPILVKALNKEQLKAATQMKNAVVSAGAGSGKTRVLAYRYAHLVINHGFEVDSILTLTFTKKATAEMYERIYSTLREVASSEDSNDIQKKRAIEAIENFHSARIQTIDSFCSAIVRASSKQYGIRPDFSIDNEGVKEYCEKLALETLLKSRNIVAVQDLIGNEKFESLVESLFVNPVFYYSNLAQDINFLDYLDKQMEILSGKWKECIDNIMYNKNIFLEANEELSETFLCIEKNLLDSIALKGYFTSIKDELTTFEERIAVTENLKKELIPLLKSILFLSKLRKSDKRYKSIAMEIDAIREGYEILTSISQYILYFAHTLELLPILQKYNDEITEWKRITGSLTYSDVSSLALRILLENPEIRKSEKSIINAIMIDEFQDNNTMQKEMLFLLAEQLERNEKSIPTAKELCPEKLFFVGDEKQSIYKFRGADVSTFRDLKNNLNETLSLSTNYRSHAQLIAGFNSIFGGYDYIGAHGAFDTSINIEKKEFSKSVFLQNFQLQEVDTFPLFEAEYVKNFSNEATELDKDKKRIHICLLNTTSNEDFNDESYNDENSDNNEDKENLKEAETLAIFTAEKIQELCENTYEPKDIAILFRSYGKQSMYEKHLRRLGIPYVAENITNFFGDAPVNDIIAFLRLIVYPKDMQSYSTLLRSPFMRLNQQEMLSCVLLCESEKDILFCEDNAKNLSKDSKIKYIETLHQYSTLREKVHHYNCTEIIQQLWYYYGYRYETMWNNDVTLFSETYDYLFDIAKKIDLEGKNLTFFIDYLYNLDKNSERLDDMNIPLERTGAVQLMSIHKSKGLEFPVVFVVGSTSKGKASKNTDKIFIDEEYGPSINFPLSPDISDCQKNYFFNKSKILEKQMQEAELRRLLYVAMTRAEQELYITGSYTVNKSTRESLEKRGIALESCVDEELYPILSEIFNCKLKTSKKNDSQVKLEYCIQNDSLFSFLLPVITSYSDKDAPFTLHTIAPKTREEIVNVNLNSKNISMQSIQKRLSPLYENSNVITTPVIESPYRSPSQLTRMAEQEQNKNDNIDRGENAIKELDSIIARKKDSSFDYSHFGTVCHAYTESMFTDKKPIIPSNIVNSLEDSELQTICAIAENMARSFIESSVGKEASMSKWQKTEHDFKLLLKSEAGNKIIIKGQIDLLYERNDGKIIILDYKTDSIEDPEHHIAQLAAYRMAVSKIYNTELENILCLLFYLRTGNTVDVTDKTNNISLEKLIFT